MPPPPLDQSALWPPGHPRYAGGYDDDDGGGYDEEEEHAKNSSVVHSGVRVRSTHRGSARYDDDDDSKPASPDDDSDSILSDPDASEPEPTQIPASTHALFFTQRVGSLPFLFALSVAGISVLCLTQALMDNLKDVEDDNKLGAPANVTVWVRIAQYTSILIALLMEEEIPTGLHLLRTVTKPAFKRKFPTKSYFRFVLSNILRIILGYLFLVNVFIILAQATAVLDIFYDVLALQFIASLDDMAFELAKKDFLGKRLGRACTARLFQTEFEKQKFGRSRAASLFLKSVYFINLVAFLGGLISVTLNQVNSVYQCDSITVDFGDHVWEDAVVFKPDTGEYVDRVLVFSTFNGVYVKSPDYTANGRPVYEERKKFNQEPFDPEGYLATVVPAQIRYCAKPLEAWCFYHPHIKKTKPRSGVDMDKAEESGELASVMLWSKKTEEYDLLDVPKEWNIWRGMITEALVHYKCNKCDKASDCNLNGECNDDGECECDKDPNNGLQLYMGTHCEVKLRLECGTIANEDNSFEFTIQYYASVDGGPLDTLFQEYNRPIYQMVDKPEANRTEGDIDWLMYTGRRWIHIGFNPIQENVTFQEVINATINYHAFWNQRYSFDSPTILFLSDPTLGDDPVGVDWYMVGERGPDYGDQFGPFGALYPIMKDGQIGRGVFKCAGPLIIDLYDEVNATDAENATDAADATDTEGIDNAASTVDTGASTNVENENASGAGNVAGEGDAADEGSAANEGNVADTGNATSNAEDTIAVESAADEVEASTEENLVEGGNATDSSTENLFNGNTTLLNTVGALLNTVGADNTTSAGNATQAGNSIAESTSSGNATQGGSSNASTVATSG